MRPIALPRSRTRARSAGALALLLVLLGAAAPAGASPDRAARKILEIVPAAPSLVGKDASRALIARPHGRDLL